VNQPTHNSCFLHGDYDGDRCPGCEKTAEKMLQRPGVRAGVIDVLSRGFPEGHERNPEGDEWGEA
jgi:hypothetical protein